MYTRSTPNCSPYHFHSFAVYKNLLWSQQTLTTLLLRYRVIAIILDIANFRLFRPVRSDVPAEKPKHFMKIKFLNKAVDAINLPALLRSTSMIEFLIDNIFVQFGGRLFRQVIGIPMGTNCAPLLAGLFLYSYENEFLDNMIRSGHRRLARSFNLCYRYTDDLIVFNNKKFLDYLKEIYPSQLTVEKANKSDHLADYLDLTFIIDSGGKLSTRLYDKRDDFDFHIVNFHFSGC